MNTQTHWEKIYTEKAPDAVSWYRPHLETSLELIESAASDFSTSIIDVGGGESTLVDDLLARGYENITVLDISQAAIDVNRKRLGKAFERVHWLVADVTQVELPRSAYDVWHDRAVFHFLTLLGDRAAYIRQVAHAVKPGGHVIVNTFGPRVRKMLPARSHYIDPSNLISQNSQQAQQTNHSRTSRGTKSVTCFRVRCALLCNTTCWYEIQQNRSAYLQTSGGRSATNPTSLHGSSSNLLN